jgi:hypothetical protein
MGQIVSVFMIGLLPFTLFYVLLRGFYALEDTRTPFLITLGFSLAWLAMAVPIFRAVGPGGPQVAGIALAYGLSYWLACIAAWVLLRRRLGGLDGRRTLAALARMVACGLVAILLTALVQDLVGPMLQQLAPAGRHPDDGGARVGGGHRGLPGNGQDAARSGGARHGRHDAASAPYPGCSMSSPTRGVTIDRYVLLEELTRPDAGPGVRHWRGRDMVLDREVSIASLTNPTHGQPPSPAQLVQPPWSRIEGCCASWT